VTVNEVEKDEMWSFAGDKSRQYWLWRTTDHDSGEPLAFHSGTREYKNPDEFLALPTPFDIKVIYCDNNYACQSRVRKREVKTGKEKKQKIERKHLSLRTRCSRLVRKGIRFSKDYHMQKIVVTLIINFSENYPINNIFRPLLLFSHFKKIRPENTTQTIP
jgi:insertion element IS1 protein InsB